LSIQHYLPEEYELLLPRSGRRLLMLVFGGLIGTVAGLIAPSGIAWKGGLIFSAALAFLAGSSALWSP